MAILDIRSLVAGAGLVYALAYLYLIGDVDPDTAGGWGVMVGELGAWTDRRGLLQFEPILLLELGPVLWLFSPVNLLLAAVLGSLLAVNLHGAWHLLKHPGQCALGTEDRGSAGAAGGGIVVALPALLAGGACCAPSLLLLLGMPGLGVMAGLFGWLMPLSLLLLVGSRVWQRRRGAPRFSWR